MVMLHGWFIPFPTGLSSTNLNFCQQVKKEICKKYFSDFKIATCLMTIV